MAPCWLLPPSFCQVCVVCVDDHPCSIEAVMFEGHDDERGVQVDFATGFQCCAGRAC
jgi:hypothetical protein